MSTKPKLLVTGISGYIGSWVTLRALQSGKYDVRGTIRDINDEKKVSMLKQCFGNDFNSLELKSANLNDEDSLARAVEGCEYILHVASPFPSQQPKNEREVIDPAVNGTLGVLKACKGSGVKRVVVTSSCAAVTDLVKTEVDESNWPALKDDMSPYYKSKILAEQAAWDYIKSLSQDQDIGLNTCNPGFVIGPLLARQGGTSQDIVTQIMTGKFPGLPDCYLAIVDVRDVADAHVRALECEPGNRLILQENTYNLLDIAEPLYDEFSPLGYKVSHGRMWKSLAWLGSFFDSNIKFSYENWGHRCHIDNSKTRELLDMQFRDVKKSVVEMGYSLIEKEFVEDKRSK